MKLDKVAMREYIGRKFGTTDKYADLNGDGIVNVLDLVKVGSYPDSKVWEIPDTPKPPVPITSTTYVIILAIGFGAIILLDGVASRRTKKGR